MVIKKNGERELFNRNKILNGILKATEKRGIALESLEKIVQSIEKDLRNRMEQEVRPRKLESWSWNIFWI